MEAKSEIRDRSSLYSAALPLLIPSIGKYYRHPAIPAPLFAQATQGRKWHVRARDQNILARELREQLKPRRGSRILVDVENRGDLGIRQLDALCRMVSPQNRIFCPFDENS